MRGSRRTTRRTVLPGPLHGRAAAATLPSSAALYLVGTIKCWYGVPAHTCQSLVDTDNGYFYGYAEVENDGGRYWSGDNGQCVAFPGPYAFWSNNARHCDDGQEVRNFVAMHTNDFGVFTWNLNP